MLTIHNTFGVSPRMGLDNRILINIRSWPYSTNSSANESVFISLLSGKYDHQNGARIALISGVPIRTESGNYRRQSLNYPVPEGETEYLLMHLSTPVTLDSVRLHSTYGYRDVQRGSQPGALPE